MCIFEIFSKIAKNRIIMDRTIMDHVCTYSFFLSMKWIITTHGTLSDPGAVYNQEISFNFYFLIC
jgi:hypothetical protein